MMKKRIVSWPGKKVRVSTFFALLYGDGDIPLVLLLFQFYIVMNGGCRYNSFYPFLLCTSVDIISENLSIAWEMKEMEVFLRFL